MIHNTFINKLNLKKKLQLLFLLLIIITVSVLVTTEIINTHPDSIQQSINDEFNKMKVHLEFNGLNNSVKDMTENYSKMFGGYTNIIITDDSGNILYATNNGYVSEKNKFIVLVDPWQANGYGSNIAYLLDSKNTIKYSAQLDISLNMNKLKEQSSRNPLAKVLFTKTQDEDDNIGDKVITNSDGTSYVNSSETRIIMNYQYVASKGLNLYSLYDSDHQYNNYYLFVNSLSTLRHWLIYFVILILIIFWILLPIWVFKDAQKQNLKTTKWVLLVFLFNIIGLGIYLIFKPKYLNCNTCNKTLEDNWIICPYCGKEININLPDEHK